MHQRRFLLRTDQCLASLLQSFRELGILHYDIVNLYPGVNTNDVYPISPTEIILSNVDGVKNYLGLTFCKIVPPGRCLCHALPAEISDTFVFALCRVCADTKTQKLCEDSNEE